MSLRGTRKRTLPAWQVAKTLDPFKVYNRTVTQLDVSQNSFDEKAFDELASVLLQNAALSRVAFQNFGCPEPIVLENFLRRRAS
jgi:hypothetical protein